MSSRAWRSPRGPSEYILAYLDADVKRETKLFHLGYPNFSPAPLATSITQLSLSCPSTVPHPAPDQTHSPAAVRPHAWIKNSPTILFAFSSSSPVGSATLRTTCISYRYSPIYADQAPAPLAPQRLVRTAPSQQPRCPVSAAWLPTPPAAHAGPAHRLYEIQTRGQHTQVKLSENSDGEVERGRGSTCEELHKLR